MVHLSLSPSTSLRAQEAGSSQPGTGSSYLDHLGSREGEREEKRGKVKENERKRGKEEKRKRGKEEERNKMGKMT